LKKVYILLLVYRNWQDALDGLASLFQSDYDYYHIIIVDNHSPNGAYRILEEKLSEKQISYNTDVNKITTSKECVSLIQTGYNGGFAFGNNFVIKYLLEEDAYVWLLNPDTGVTRQTLSNLINCASQTPFMAAWGAKVVSYTDTNKLLMYGGGTYNLWGKARTIKQLKDASKLRYIHGGCLFTHVSNFKKNGLIDEDYFLYWEETDWCYRFMQAGGKLLVCQQAVIYDKIGGSVGRGYWQSYFMTYNKYRFYHRFFASHLVKIILTIPYFLAIEIASLKPKRVQGFLRATYDFFIRRKMSIIQ